MPPSTSRLLGPIQRRLAHLVARAVVTLVNDATRMQALQLGILADEPLDNVEHWQPYGYTYKPHAGAEALVVAVGGHRAHSVVIACADRRYRLAGLEDGEVALYDDLGNTVQLLRDKVQVTAVQTLELKAPHVTINGNVAITGTVTNNGRNIGSTHTHPGDSGGSTGAPQ